MHKKKFCDLCILPVDIFRGKGYYSHNDTGIVNKNTDAGTEGYNHFKQTGHF